MSARWCVPKACLSHRLAKSFMPKQQLRSAQDRQVVSLFPFFNFVHYQQLSDHAHTLDLRRPSTNMSTGIQWPKTTCRLNRSSWSRCAFRCWVHEDKQRACKTHKPLTLKRMGQSGCVLKLRTNRPLPASQHRQLGH